MKGEVGAKSDIVRRRFIMTMNSATFLPDWASPPGETILDLMNEKAWTQVELAQKLGYTLKQLKLMIEGKVSLTEDTALRLEQVLGSTVNFWLNREIKYRVHLTGIEPLEKTNTQSI
jgi:HTH-type transcriptional regulator/antitoxin HigA